MTSFSSHALRRTVLFCCAFVFLALAGAVRADDAPTFSDPDVTAYVKEFSATVDQFTAVMKDYLAAAKANDSAKLEASAKKVQDYTVKMSALEEKGKQLEGKVKPEELQKFSDYLQASAKKMADSLQ